MEQNNNLSATKQWKLSGTDAPFNVWINDYNQQKEQMNNMFKNSIGMDNVSKVMPFYNIQDSEGPCGITGICTPNNNGVPKDKNATTEPAITDTPTEPKQNKNIAARFWANKILRYSTIVVALAAIGYVVYNQTKN